jgi:hypothetical protein
LEEAEEVESNVMNKKKRSLASIKSEIRSKKTLLNEIYAARVAVRNTALPLAERGAEAAPLTAMLAATPAKRTFPRPCFMTR